MEWLIFTHTFCLVFFVLELLKGRLGGLLKTVNIPKSLFNSHTTSAVIITTMETS